MSDSNKAAPNSATPSEPQRVGSAPVPAASDERVAERRKGERREHHDTSDDDFARGEDRRDAVR